MKSDLLSSGRAPEARPPHSVRFRGQAYHCLDGGATTILAGDLRSARTLALLREEWGPKALPEGAYFMLGDNRDNSRDSRFWGFVDEETIGGRATVVYWSWDPERRRVRWERIGRRLE